MTRRASLLLVVSVLLPTTRAAAQLDHLKCYKIKDPLQKTQYTATLDGLAVENGCVVKIPGKTLCVPATKSNVSPTPPGGGGVGTPNRFICYKVKCPRTTLAPVPVTDQFGTRSVTPSVPKLLCAPVESPTTTTTTSSTTTTTQPSDCCGPQRIELTSTAGQMAIRTLVPFPLPPGIVARLDTAPGTPLPHCVHPAIVPAGGFSVPVFCVPAIGFTATMTPRGCTSGGNDGRGTVWDAASLCPDADVSKVGDTSDPDGNSCGTLGSGCSTGGAGDDTGGNIDTTRGDGVCDAAAHLRFDVPLTVDVWNDADGLCPDADAQFDPGTDVLVAEFDTILSPTTATANADFTDLNGDACSLAGGGPDHTKHCSGDASRLCTSNSHCTSPPAGTCVDGPLRGVPPPSCCAIDQGLTVVASAPAFIGAPPLFDSLFSVSLQMVMTACDPWPGPATCALTTNPCED